MNFASITILFLKRRFDNQGIPTTATASITASFDTVDSIYWEFKVFYSCTESYPPRLKESLVSKRLPSGEMTIRIVSN